ncbi:MAG: molecular chaperone HtpG, partial [Pseudomonadota bacterium]
LLDIVANALYTNRDVFLRELISNAADACDRLRYDALQNPKLTKGDPDFKIRIKADSEANTLTISDNGIGMDKDDLINNLGTIARSGTAAIMEQMKNAEGDLNLIGQFGVGFYASFMIADSVDVISRKAGDDKTHIWTSDGKTGFEVNKADKDQASILACNRGTSIVIHLKSNAYDFLVDDKLKQIILTYSDHIDIPVYVGDEDEPVNAASALWMRPKSEITNEQYKEFYHHIGQLFDEPLMTSHWKAEGKIEFSALLYIPSMRPWDLYDPSRQHVVKLYVKRVFITDNLENLVYPWLRFLRGVIDSEDLPLNISREMLQMNPVVDTIRRSVTKRILSDLNKLSQNDKTAFEALWHQFGMVIKEGLYDAVEHREDIFKICRFHCSESNDLISLDDYIENMKEDQRSIYYMAGESLESLKNSPQLEGFKARGLNVILMTDTVDNFWLQNVQDYNGKFFQSITKGHIDLSRYDTNKPDDAEDKKEDTKAENNSENIDTLLELFKSELKDHVHDVTVSSRLTDSPVCLIAPDSGVDMHMESVLKIQQKYENQTKPVLEVNKDHALIQKLSELGNSETTKETAWLLLDQARIIQGQSVPDPTAFARRMSAFLEKGLAA